MNDIFHSSKLRLSRAKDHIIDLEKSIRAFLDTKPYARVIEPDSDGINQLHKIKFTKSLPDEFAIITADAVDNLRSALDHAWHAIAVASSAIKPTGEAYFPFADNAAKFKKRLIGCKKFPQDILALLRRFQPHKGGDDLLWALNRICAANKHRMLAPIGIAVGGMHIRYMTFSGPGSIPMPRWDRAKQEIIYAIVGPNGKIEYNIDITFDVAFDKVEAVGGQPAIAILNALASKVEDILKALEGAARKLGYV